MSGGDKARIETQELGEPLAISFLGRIGNDREQRNILAVVEASVGVVVARMACAGAGGVVGGGALRDKREAAAAGLVMQEEFLQRRDAGIGRRAQLQAYDQQPIESRACL